MSLLTKKGKEVKEELKVGREEARAKTLTSAFLNHLDAFHSLDEKNDKDIERAVLDDELNSIDNPKKINFKRGLVTFSPSSASKCERELYYKAKKAPKDTQPFFPYQRRWVRNGSAVHAAVQKDLLYAEKHLQDPAFEVVRMKNPASVKGRPAWEHNLKDVKHFEELGFQVFGMMDGVLLYTPDGSKIGFEFKTKSTTIAAVGDYKMKAPQPSHMEQVTAYSILFGLEEFLLVYESVAKDWWGKGNEARKDVKAFLVKVTEEQRAALIKKFTKVAKAVKNNEVPQPEYDKCIFCPYKKICEEEGFGN